MVAGIPADDGSGGGPSHVAIIMDGNGRWASQHGKPRHAGHRSGVRVARTTVEAAAQANIRVLTLFAFSSENWKRPASEVDGLMRLFVEALQREVKALHSNGIQLRFIGDRAALPTILRRRMDDAEALTAGNIRMTMVLAVAYGGQWDVVQATQRIAAKVKAGELDPADIDVALIDRHRSLAGLPAPDLLVRTGGEHRVSNFLLWDLAYTEIYFTPTLWPDFSPEELARACSFYRQRQRRFGQTSEQLEAIGD
jgi:undecaprenyl diphosphate synthase